jgi:hypothetical protein
MKTLGASNRQGAAGVRISGGGDWLAPANPAGSRPYVPTSARGGDLRVHLFLAAIAQGLPAAGAMEAFGTLGRGSFSHDDKCFYPESAALGPIADRIGLLSTARRLVVSGCEGEGDITIFLLAGAVAAIVSDKSLHLLGPVGGWWSSCQ